MNREDQILIAKAYQLIQERDTVGRAYRIVKGSRDTRGGGDTAAYWKAYHKYIKERQAAADSIERRNNNKVRVEHAIFTQKWFESPRYSEADRDMSFDEKFHRGIINRLDFLLSKPDNEISVTVLKKIAGGNEHGHIILTGIASNLLEYYTDDAFTVYPRRDGKEDSVNKFPMAGSSSSTWDEAIVNLQDIKWDGYYNGLDEPNNVARKYDRTGTRTYTRHGYYYQNDPEKKIIGYLYQKDNPITDETTQKLITGELRQRKIEVTEGIPLSKKVDGILSKKGLKKYDNFNDLYKLRNM